MFNVLKLGVPLVNLKHDPLNPRYDYAFKFWHASVNGNELRIDNKHLLKNDSITQNVFLPGNNDEYKEYFLVSVSPNPTENELNIVSLGSTIAELWLMDTSGKNIYHQKLTNNNNHSFSIKNFSNGFYFLSVKSMNGIVKVFKIIKQ